MARVRALYTAAEKRAPVHRQPAVQARSGCGIVGDRHYRRGNAPEQQITLIEWEQVRAFCARHGAEVDPATLRRNVLTEGVALNDLPGHRFQVGAVLLRGVELCEPCTVVGHLLARPGLAPRDVIRSLLGRGGLRAEILGTGVIREGDRIDIDPEPRP